MTRILPLVFLLAAAPAFAQTTASTPVRVTNTVTAPIFMTLASAGAPVTLSQDASHDSPVKSAGPQIMCEAMGGTGGISAQTPVADGDAIRVACDRLGRIITAGHCDREARLRGVTSITGGAPTVAQGFAAGAANVYLEVTDAMAGNSGDTDVTVDIRDGASGDIMWTLIAGANFSGSVVTFETPLTSSAATAIYVDPSGSSSTVIVSLSGCKVK